MKDIRLNLIKEKLKDIEKIICVDGVKGGIGKTLISLGISLILKKLKKKVGLLDLDFSSPTLHLFFKKNHLFFHEERGLHPLSIYGLKFVSIYYFMKDKLLPIREKETRKLIREIFTIFQWGKLDYLIIDMPPGLSSPFLEILLLIKNPQFLIITKKDPLVFTTTRKIIDFLKRKNKKILGVIENFKQKRESLKEEIESLNLKYLGGIRFDSQLSSLKGIKELRITSFYKDLEKIIKKLESTQR